jgi:hypothetical protein
VCWGIGFRLGCNIPGPNTDFVTIAAGSYHNLGLKSDGTIVAWGQNGFGQCDVPVPNTDFEAIAAGRGHSLGLKSDGSIVAWGDNRNGQCDVPAPNANFEAVAAGAYHSLGRRGDRPVPVAFGSFAANAGEGAVVLYWTTAADEALSGFRLYRAQGSGQFSCITERSLSPYTSTYEDRKIEPGMEYRYIVAAVTLDDREVRSQVVTVSSITPQLVLQQNVPNPFNPRTTIGFSLPSSQRVLLAIYDAQGRCVRRLFDGFVPTGQREITWDGKDDEGRPVASGVYFYRLRTGKQVLTRKMLLLK